MSMDAADPTARLQAAVAAHRAGRLVEAEQQYRAVLVDEPENPNALHLLGVVYRQRGQPETAATLITQALQYAPALADAHANLGNVYSDMRLFESAVQAYEHARTLGSRGPDNDRRLVAALEAAASVHLAEGRREQARHWLERALVEAPDRVEVIQALLPYYVEEDRLHALTMAARAWRLRPDRGSFRLVWDLCNRAGEDLELARAHLAAQPDDAFRMIAVGNALRRSRRGWEAEALYRTARELEPGMPFASMRLACLMLEQGRVEAAEHCLRAAERGDPGRIRTMQFSSAFFRKLARRPLPLPPAGFVPPSPAEGIVIFAACDGAYFERFASALLHSAERNSGLGHRGTASTAHTTLPEAGDAAGQTAATRAGAATPCRYHLHVVNPPPDARERIEAHRAMLGDVAIALTTETIDTANWDDERRRTWFACARFRLLPHLMEAYAAPILMLDADMLVLRDLRGLIEMASGGDVAAVATERHVCEPWNWFWADVVFFNATPRALSFADLVARYVEHHLQAAEAHWFLDQIALTACLLAGFADGAAPRFVALPTDIHRLSLVCRDGVDEAPGPHVLFWSAHASTVDTSMTLQMPRYQDYVLPWPWECDAAEAETPVAVEAAAVPPGATHAEGDGDPNHAAVNGAMVGSSTDGVILDTAPGVAPAGAVLDALEPATLADEQPAGVADVPPATPARQAATRVDAQAATSVDAQPATTVIVQPRPPADPAPDELSTPVAAAA